MGLSAEKSRMTADEFVAWEIEQPGRWEWVDGECFAMTGGTDVHNTLCLNLAFALRQHLRGGPCGVFMTDVKLKIASGEAVLYPDVFVSCDQADRSRRLWKEAPILIAEVLSPSTEAYDRGRKFEAYRQIAGLAAVLLLSQTRPRAECYTRAPQGAWLLTDVDGNSGVIALPALDLRVPLSELYRDLPEDAENVAAGKSTPRE
jgi:Uma2 family endonuclease